MNFVTSALDAMRRMQAVCTRAGEKYDENVFHSLCMDLEHSMKFLVPGPTQLNVKATQECLEFVRLPYPVCAFEYSILNPETKGLSETLQTASSTNRIALAYDLESPSQFVTAMKKRGHIAQDAKGLAVVSLYQLDTTKEWMPSIGFGVFDRVRAVYDTAEHLHRYFHLKRGLDQERPEFRTPFFIDNTITNFVFSVYSLIRYGVEESRAGGERARAINETMVNDITEELAMAVRVALLLNTKNLKVVKAVEAPEKLNAKRKRNGKQPFFSYHTLDIFVSNTPLRSARKRVDFGGIQQYFSNYSTRLHSVRGHFKHRATGLFWWSFYVRGSKSAGSIVKDYDVHSSKQK